MDHHEYRLCDYALAEYRFAIGTRRRAPSPVMFSDLSAADRSAAKSIAAVWAERDRRALALREATEPEITIRPRRRERRTG